MADNELNGPLAPARTMKASAPTAWMLRSASPFRAAVRPAMRSVTAKTAQVARLAELTKNSGLDGIVCSGHEVAARHAAWPEGQFVVPGLRPGGMADGDQKRVMSPRDALDAGATVLVIGRPITGADDPAEAARAIAATLA